MFEKIESAPLDPILGLTETFQKDPRTDKINLGVGVYLDENGKIPTFAAVRTAERRVVEEGAAKSYLPISGSSRYGALVQSLVFGDDSQVVKERRASTVHTPGGTGALRVAADFIATHAPSAKVWVSTPTWENHHKIFGAAGLETRPYRYYDATHRRLDVEGMLHDLSSASRGDVVLVHGSCHNPTGVDLSRADWESFATLCLERGLVPLVDLAYQGLGDGLDDDAFGVRLLAAKLPEFFVASSFSKSFGLYGERTGALSIISEDGASAERVMSQMKVAVRTNYSNPPRHGGVLVEMVLSEPGLTTEWKQELAVMRSRIKEMRQGLVDGLKSEGVDRDFAFLLSQRGMFSYTGLSPEHVDALREKLGVYILRSGRINVAGLTPKNLGRVAEAIATVLRS